MKLFVQAIITLISVTGHNAYALPSGTQCHERHPLECAIKTLQPALAAGEARLLSNYIARYSKKYNVDPYRVIAIGMQESSLRQVNRYREYKTPTGVQRVVTDIGLFQFNINTIDAYEMDFERLQTSLEYQVEMACWLLSRKLVYCSDLGMEAWACYHSRTDKHRLLYQELVNRYYKGEQYVGIREASYN